ncbi:MAG: hypothetical protein ACOX1P_06665 [Thermoguttaceae bacterium]|jgi:hypothetical protein
MEMVAKEVHPVERTVKTGEKAGYSLFEVGQVQAGERRVIFQPEKITLPAIE